MRKEKTKNNPSTEEEKEVLSLSSEPSAKEPTAAAELSKEKTSEKEAVGGNEMPLENEGRDEQVSSLRKEKEHEAVLSSPEKKDSSLKKETAFDAEKQNEESEKSEKDGGRSFREKECGYAGGIGNRRREEDRACRKRIVRVRNGKEISRGKNVGGRRRAPRRGKRRPGNGSAQKIDFCKD